MMKQHEIFTIGHSTRTLDELVKMLTSFSIELLVDIRSFPGSRKFPQFNKENLEATIPLYGIEYLHMRDLGGRRKALPVSHNMGWRLAAFRGYADYMETPGFLEAIKKLEKLATKKRVAYMCSEAVWWRCHRSLVSDYLKLKGWKVMHIMAIGKAEEHPYTSPAKIIDGKLDYSPGTAS
ncbi:MAG: Fe-S cluster assembly protein HesB [Niastella sp. SCN 39-18]|nr:DUF488 domain-containing protein [Sphingobacteriales bacterium]ODT53861.1 MAG: Fe-S cluster assembly protein HesB [Niastella sp. SCN 39-18]OJW07574.1 MAG: Fe-S cluster assembly protein HesB [Sphingobacteriales bacterium 39-19]